MTALGKAAKGLQTFTSDVAQGFFEITHNGFALVGLATVCLVLTLFARPGSPASADPEEGGGKLPPPYLREKDYRFFRWPPGAGVALPGTRWFSLSS